MFTNIAALSHVTDIPKLSALDIAGLNFYYLTGLIRAAEFLISVRHHPLYHITFDVIMTLLGRHYLSLKL